MSTALLSPIKKLETYFALSYFWAFAQCVQGTCTKYDLIRTKNKTFLKSRTINTDLLQKKDNYLIFHYNH